MTAKYVGFETGYPIVEIEWLEIHPAYSHARLAFRALCEAFTAAIELADSNTAIAVSPLEEKLEDSLSRRADFVRIDSSPFPFVISFADAEILRGRLCR